MNWYAVQSKSGAEYVAETELRRYGLTVYLPQFRKEFRHPRSKAWVSKSHPLFQGWLFVASEGFSWAAVNACNGIPREEPILLDHATSKPLCLADGIIQRIKDNEAAGVFDDIRQGEPRLQVGASVEISDSAFVGLRGIVQHAKHRNRKVLTVLLTTGVEVTVPLEQVRKVA